MKRTRKSYRNPFWYEANFPFSYTHFDKPFFFVTLYICVAVNQARYLMHITYVILNHVR